MMLFSCSQQDVLTQEEEEWLKEHPNLNVGIFSYYPPYLFTNEKGNIDGVLIDYLNLIEKKIDYKFKKIYYTNWDTLLKDTENGKVDMILEITETENRKKFLNFTPSVFVTPYSIIAKKETKTGIPLQNFKSKKIVVVKNYSIHEHLLRNYKDYTIFTEDNDSTCLKKVSDGVYDAYIGIKTSSKHLIKINEFDNLKIISDLDYNFKQSIATHKNLGILHNIISKTIQLSPSEEKEIIDAWFYTMITPFYMQPSFWILISSFAIILLIIILFLNAFLKHRVKQKTQELYFAKEKAEESDRLKTHFLQNISHEIRTPMNGIIGFTDIINDLNISEKEREKYISLIANSSKLLIRTIDDILEISELQTKNNSISNSQINLNHFLDSLYVLFEIKANQNNIPLYLEKSLSDDLCYISIDEEKLKTILNNVIENAIKFTQKGFIKISYSIEEKEIIISIQDTGIGIRTVSQDYIFNNFSQENIAINKKHGGLGLGLSIAKENAKLINGSISFESKEGIGSTFLIKLPYIPITENAFNNDVHNIVKHNLPKRIVLIVEDGEVNYIYLKAILKKMKGFDFTIYRAENGKDAVEICTNDAAIDLVLMDIKMPIMDGYDATKRIKKIRPHLPIIAQTAYSTKEDINRALIAGCDDFVSKPVDRKLLRPIIQKHIS